MLWLTWRQHRWQLIGTTLLLALYWTYLLGQTIRVRHAIDDCPPMDSHEPMSGACQTAYGTTVTNVHNSMGDILLLGNLLPLAAGMFWGASLLARELEQGTYRLAFMQSVSRHRWLAVKLGVLIAAAALLGAITGAVVRWSQTAFPALDQPLSDKVTFSQSGLVPVGSWVFALLAGVVIGLLVRRTTAAIAVTVVALPLVFMGLTLVRPHYIPPVEQVLDAAHMVADPMPEDSRHGWLLEMSYVDPAGRGLSSATAGAICADPSNTYPTADCLRRTGLRQRVVYQPAGRYLWFQLVETGLLLVASAAMVLVVRRVVTHHLA